jgi:hypothetical protein
LKETRVDIAKYDIDFSGGEHRRGGIEMILDDHFHFVAAAHARSSGHVLARSLGTHAQAINQAIRRFVGHCSQKRRWQQRAN